MTEAKRTSKAQQFALVAEGLGWAVERIKGKKDTTARRVIATRGEEKYVMTWSRASGRENFTGGTYTIKEQTEPVRLVKAVMEAMARPAGHAKTHADGHVSRLPFDPITATDTEVLSHLAGKRITWRNDMKDENETALVPRGGLHLRIETAPNGKRIVSFVNAADNEAQFRAVYLDSIRAIR